MFRLSKTFLPRRATPSLISFSSSRPSPFGQGPSPQKLSASEQAEFERLQRDASLSSAIASVNAAAAEAAAAEEGKTKPSVDATVASAAAAAAGDGVLYRGSPPEFEGDKNPKTGEVGGPKREPLRWGAGGDYSYNGRVTDF